MESDAEFIKRIQLLAVDHPEDGWPAIQMKDVSRLLSLVPKPLPPKTCCRELLEAAKAFLTGVRATHPVPYEDWADEANHLERVIEKLADQAGKIGEGV